MSTERARNVFSARIALPAVLCLAFTPAASAESNLSIGKKAELFDRDLYGRFVIDGQLAPKLRSVEPVDGVPSYNMPDNAYMTGIYTGILAMKYAVTKEEETRRRGSEAIQALHLLCTASGIPGLLARAVVTPEMAKLDDGDWQPAADGKRVWRADVSSDQMDGVFYGFLMAFDFFANEEEKKQIAEDVSALMDYLIKHNYRIIDYNGRPTKWGNYTEGYVTTREPLNALILLQHLKVAHHITNNPQYGDLYRHFAVEKKYGEVAVKARNYRLRSINYSDDILLWLAYYPLLRLEKSSPELAESYKASLRRSWEGEGPHKGIKDEDIPLFNFMVAEFLDDKSGIESAARTLRLFPLNMKWNGGTIAKYEKEFGFTYNAAPASPVPKQGELVPIDRRPKLWSAWVHSPYESGDRTLDIAGEFNGHDYLMAYWYGRYLNLIDADQ